MNGWPSSDAQVFWRLSDQAKTEASRLRERASQLDLEAERLSSVAAAIADGRSLEEGMRL